MPIFGIEFASQKSHISIFIGTFKQKNIPAFNQLVLFFCGIYIQLIVLF